MAKNLKIGVGIFISFFWLVISYTPPVAYNQDTFRFTAWADTKSGTAVLNAESIEVKKLNPLFTLYAGDVCDSGPDATCFATWENAINGALNGGASNNLFDYTFASRGNHDNDATFWVSHFDFASVGSRIGVKNFTSLNPNLTYSFDYGNSHFVSVDVPGDVTLMSSAEIVWLDTDLTNAQNRGLTHAFLFWHGPVYATAEHCCPVNNELNMMLAKHPIISATFHGHEHVVDYVHMDSGRYATIDTPAKEYEEVTSGDAGAGPDTCINGRYDWWLGNSNHGFVIVDVSGSSFTVNFYRMDSVGSTPASSLVKSYSFTKNPQPLQKIFLPMIHK